MKRRIIFIVLTICFTSFFSAKGQKIEAIEDSLAVLFNNLNHYTSIEKRDSCHNIFLDLFLQTIKQSESYEYPFNKLEKIGKITSDDGIVRCYSWNLLPIDGKYCYFAFLQIRTKQGDNKIIRLVENPDITLIPDNMLLNSQNWYGALYYKLFHVPDKTLNQYILFGWDGNNNRSMKKIIDVLTVNPDQTIYLGAPIFNANNQVKYREVFEYSSKGKMSLTYDKKNKRILFDHLVPINPRYKGIYEFYGPDYSFDAYIWDNKQWIFKQDVNPNK